MREYSALRERAFTVSVYTWMYEISVEYHSRKQMQIIIITNRFNIHHTYFVFVSTKKTVFFFSLCVCVCCVFAWKMVTQSVKWLCKCILAAVVLVVDDVFSVLFAISTNNNSASIFAGIRLPIYKSKSITTCDICMHSTHTHNANSYFPCKPNRNQLAPIHYSTCICGMRIISIIVIIRSNHRKDNRREWRPQNISHFSLILYEYGLFNAKYLPNILITITNVSCRIFAHIVHGMRCNYRICSAHSINLFLAKCVYCERIQRTIQIDWTTIVYGCYISQ